MYHTILLSIHWALCFFLIILVVLLQQGKGADMGVAFGGGSNTLFGASGANTLLVKITTTVAVLFMCSSFMLVRHYNAGGIQVASPAQALKGSVVEELAKKQAEEAAANAGQAPAVPVGEAPISAAPVEEAAPVSDMPEPEKAK